MKNLLGSLAFQEQGGGGTMMMLLWVAIVVLLIASVWKVFTKAGKPGWAAIVPIYNIIVLLQIAGKPVWWIILMFIPLVNLVIVILTYAGVAKNFGKGVGFALGLIFLSPIFFPILAWSDAQYQPQAQAAG